MQPIISVDRPIHVTLTGCEILRSLHLRGRIYIWIAVFLAFEIFATRFPTSSVSTPFRSSIQFTISILLAQIKLHSRPISSRVILVPLVSLD